MKVLVLGHGKRYDSPHLSMRSSPPEAGDWWTIEHTSVDKDPSVEPDIVYDLNTMPWTFCEPESYDRVIDASGTVFVFGFRYSERFLKEVFRILKPGGMFYGRRNTIQKPDRS